MDKGQPRGLPLQIDNLEDHTAPKKAVIKITAFF
jgi:hypothetical protein